MQLYHYVSVTPHLAPSFRNLTSLLVKLTTQLVACNLLYETRDGELVRYVVMFMNRTLRVMPHCTEVTLWIAAAERSGNHP